MAIALELLASILCGLASNALYDLLKAIIHRLRK